MSEFVGKSADAANPDRPDASDVIAIWDWPLRLWHWAFALCVLTAWFTPNTYDSLHRIAGYAVLGLLAFRLVWGFAGTRYSRFHRLPAKLRAFPSYMAGLGRGKTGRYLGLNPAGAAMLVAMLVALAISAVSGAMQVTVMFFGVWWVEDTHAFVSDLVMVLVVVHVAGVILMSVLQRENLPRAMITGRKRRRTG